ncbi:ABC transporter permease [Spirochaeta cellobiosiphila]|uniref:ABC transporter permease n=1 Tax=Spirochaeta cellobiosiphila TaxID=504483 RepID=UPI000401D9AE|nr:ABC transporter permease [Spirochaeta cellobiosiphila]
MYQIIEQIFPYAIAYTVPLLITSLGGLFSERSGVVNIGLEGLMIVGAFTSAFIISVLQDIMPGGAVWVGLLAAVLAGAIFSLLHAFASINLNADQVISGTAINMMAAALTVYIARNITGSGNIQIKFGLDRLDIPLLSKIPFLGPLFFSQAYMTTWLVLLILLAGWYVLYKTPLGLRIRACGENPHAADAAGINVYAIRYVGVVVSGAFAALGGAIIIVTYSGEFNGGVAGLGFLALASLIFGQWKPLGILGATFFFGFASTIANVSQVMPSLSSIPPILLKIFPYVVTLFALVFFSKTTQAPKASGEPFDKGKR